MMIEAVMVSPVYSTMEGWLQLFN